MEADLYMVPKANLDEAIVTGLNVALIGEAGAGKEWSARRLHLQRKSNEFHRYDFQNGVPELWSLVAGFISDLNFWLGGFPRRTDTRFFRNIHGLNYKQANFIIDYLHALLIKKQITSSELLGGGLVCSCEPKAAETSPWKELIIQFFPVEIHIPPLRERKEEIPRLVSEILREYQISAKKSVVGIQSEAVEILSVHDWPGNISELKSVLGQACALTRDRELISRDVIAKRIMFSKNGSPVK
ncbi:MAG: hypothetical protein L0Y74_02340 [candidate division Zixibacteria bacterium]|nr:hypothetical protein [candidate division Zixibacteria bacterium]